MLELVPEGRPVSIERDVFPRLAEEGAVFGAALLATGSMSERRSRTCRPTETCSSRTFTTEIGEALGADFTLVDGSAEVHADARLVPPVYVGPGAIVGSGARVGSLAVLGEGSRLGGRAVVENAVVGARATVGAGSVVVGSVIGDDAELGDGCELPGLAVIGSGASLGAASRLDHGLRVGADQQIPDKALRFS